MAILSRAGEVEVAFGRKADGTIVELDAILDRQGRTLYQRTALPRITTFSASPGYARTGAAAGNVTLEFAVTGSNRNRIRRLSDNANVPLTTSTSAIVAASAADETYRLEASNAEGAVHRDVPFYRWMPPAFFNVEFGTVQQPTTGTRVPRLVGDIAIAPWLAPTLTLSPEQDGFSSHQFARSVETGTADRRHFILQGNPRLQTEPVRRVTIELTAQLRIGGVNVGAPVTHSVTASY